MNTYLSYLMINKSYFKNSSIESVRNRIRTKHGKIRSRENDYLLDAFMETLVVNY